MDTLDEVIVDARKRLLKYWDDPTIRPVMFPIYEYLKSQEEMLERRIQDIRFEISDIEYRMNIMRKEVAKWTKTL